MTGLQQAIHLTAIGRYAQALGIADAIDEPEVRVEALALRGSILRQLADYEGAEDADTRAVRGSIGAPWDAVIGLVADAVGRGDLPLAEERWTALAGTLPSPRLEVRRCWVGAELALARSDSRRAVASGRRAVDLAAGVSQRHLAKSRALLGACLLASGDQPRGVASLRAAALSAGEWRPVLWPTAWVLATTLEEPEAGRWRAWARDLVAGIAAGLTPSLLAGWRRDPAAASLLDRR